MGRLKGSKNGQHYMMRKYKCKICAKIFSSYDKTRVTCSMNCRKEYSRMIFSGRVSPMKGRKQTNKWREAIGLANKGNKYGSYKRTDEFKNKLSEYWRNNKEKHNHWKGGITPLAVSIRNSQEGGEWKIKIFKRDNYTCQECYQKNGNGKSIFIEAHHKKRFSIILSEFLKQYDQFSPVEDKETLFRLAIKHEPFWDISNGITLCNKCHDKTRGRIKNAEALYEDS